MPNYFGFYGIGVQRHLQNQGWGAGFFWRQGSVSCSSPISKVSGNFGMIPAEETGRYLDTRNLGMGGHMGSRSGI